MSADSDVVLPASLKAVAGAALSSIQTGARSALVPATSTDLIKKRRRSTQEALSIAASSHRPRQSDSSLGSASTGNAAAETTPGSDKPGSVSGARSKPLAIGNALHSAPAASSTASKLPLGKMIPAVALPDLPPITDPLLATHAVTHVSCDARRKHPFEEPDTHFRGDYEKLALIGDAFLKDSVAVLVNKMYPRLAVGSFTAIMSVLLSNEILAQLSGRYGITPRVLTAEAAYAIVVEQTVNGGAMFEAHVDKYDGDGVDVPIGDRTWKTSRNRDAAVRKWLEELFRPLVVWRYDEEKRLSQPTWKGGAVDSAAAARQAEPVSSGDDNPYPPQPHVDPALVPGALGWLEAHIRRPSAPSALQTQCTSESSGLSSRAWHHVHLQLVSKSTGEVRAEARATCRRLRDAKNEAAARIRQSVNAGELVL